jgi:hypothetical protein
LRWSTPSRSQRSMTIARLHSPRPADRQRTIALLPQKAESLATRAEQEHAAVCSSSKRRRARSTRSRQLNSVRMTTAARVPAGEERAP